MTSSSPQPARLRKLQSCCSAWIDLASGRPLPGYTLPAGALQTQALHFPCCLKVRDACREHHVRNPVRVPGAILHCEDTAEAMSKSW